MKNLKKLLAVIVAICVLATFTVPAFAAETTAAKTDAEIATELGVILGEGGGVTADYLATQPTRLQGAIMFLRLKGLEGAAKAFTGTDNFEDVSVVNDTNKAILAYLKANPDLGFQGVGDNKFAPLKEMTAKEYYKILLVALGYEENTDFTWANVLSFAAGKGLSALIDNEKFTVNDLCIGTVEALKATVKGGTDTLITKLVEGNSISAEKATASGLYTAKPVVVSVASVSANNLKQVVVVFNGAVDKDSAENKENYSIDGITFESASLADDGKTVTLSLDKSSETATSAVFQNQKEYKITVDGVKDSAGKAVLKADKFAFTAVDTTVPTVKEVIALGTKALKVVFTEPVKGSTAATTAAYKIDGKSIAGSVKYNFSDSVIITTTMTTGEHKLTVDGAADFANFKVVAKDIAFVVAEDVTAPEIASAKAIDLLKVEVVFNEPVKAVSKAYHTSSSNTGTVAIDDTKVTITFASTKKMTINNTTITLEGVEDYSGNKATRTVDVTPTLDTERPTVSSVKVEKDGSVHKFTVTFSESVVTADAQKGANYVIKDKDAKVVTGKGLNSKGSPASTVYTDSKKQAVFSLTGLLDAGTYTIEISGIQDNAFVANTMMPYTETFTVGDTKAPTISKTWIEQTLVAGSSPAKYDAVIYVQFSEDMAVEGNGNVLDKVKYNYALDYNAVTKVGSWLPISTDSVVETVTADTIKITLPRSTTNYNVAGLGLRINLVSDVAGNFLGSNYVETTAVGAQTTITINSAKATAKDSIKVEFAGVLTNIDAGDFGVGATIAGHKDVSLESYSTKDGKTTAIFTLAEDDKLAANAGAGTINFLVVDAQADVATQDSFGAKVTAAQSVVLADEIVAEAIDFNYVTTSADDEILGVEYTSSAGTYRVVVRFDEAIAITTALYDIVSVKIDGTEAAVIGMTVENTTDLVISLGSPVKKSDGTAITVNNINSIWDVELKEANDTAKIIKDTPAGNAVKAFTRSQIASDATKILP